MAFNQVTWPYRFLFLLVFSAALMIVDHRSRLFVPVRTVFSVVSLPFQGLIGLPVATRAWFGTYWPDDSLQLKYIALKAEKLALEVRLQRYQALRTENEHLSELLGTSRKVEGRELLAEIIEIGLGPFNQRLALNRGKESGVYLGQPVVTADGVLGQISGLGYGHSVVTLITNPAHALPVQVQRSGLRTIVRGLGGTDRVEAPFLSAQADIRVDDVLITSGIGGGFPPGYKVAQVREIVVDANQSFMTVDAIPFADIAYTREVLLLWVDRSVPATPDIDGDE